MQDQAVERDRRQWQDARARLQAATRQPALRRQAHRLLWELCQVLGEREEALSHLQAAIAEDPLFRHVRPHLPPPDRSVLMLAVPGDFQSNLPLDRLFDERTALHTLWIADPEAVLQNPAAAVPAGLPPIDCVFIAIAEDARHRAALRAADALADVLGRPTINRAARIAALSRSGMAALLQDASDIVVPSHHEVAHGATVPIDFPAIIRPLGSHAGQGLQRVDDTAELAAYYAAHRSVASFTVAPFVDYRSADGWWRKYRVIFVDGVAYPLHLAIHDDWAVWYYNAQMRACPSKQDEEWRFLGDMAGFLPRRAADALGQLAARVGLDYFGLDCAVMPDGRLLVFEIETGMIVHDRSAERPSATDEDPCQRIRRAVERLIDRRAGRAPDLDPTSRPLPLRAGGCRR